MHIFWFQSTQSSAVYLVNLNNEESKKWITECTVRSWSLPTVFSTIPPYDLLDICLCVHVHMEKRRFAELSDRLVCYVISPLPLSSPSAPVFRENLSSTLCISYHNIELTWMAIRIIEKWMRKLEGDERRNSKTIFILNKSLFVNVRLQYKPARSSQPVVTSVCAVSYSKYKSIQSTKCMQT